MSKKLTQKELWQQFFKHVTHPLNGRVVQLRLIGDALMANDQIIGDVGTESIEMGIVRLVKLALEEKVAEYEQKRVALDRDGGILREELMRASDTLASQGLSVDKDYGPAEKDENMHYQRP